MANRFRVIPVLLLRNSGLYKTVKFKSPSYIGDPINAVRIFNEKEVDELVFLDIEATSNNQLPNYEIVKSIASECFMPLCYGGGIRDAAVVEKLLKCGVEKVAINSCLTEKKDIVREICRINGSSTIVASVDYKKRLLGGHSVFSYGGRKRTDYDPLTMCKMAEDLGVGEILLNCIDRDGTMSGFDLDMINAVSNSVSVPVIACGGASCLSDFQKAVRVGGASAAAAGAFFVYTGKHRAVLITYPSQSEFAEEIYKY